MPFDVGDKVVYPHHGAATIEKREKKEAFGKKQEYLVLRLAYGDLTLMVPADNAEEIGLRDVINDEEVEEVFAVLRKKEARMPTNWSRRFKNHVEKLKSGDIYQVAEVVRNLTIREKDKGLSAGEKRMLGKARQILVSELTFALKLDEETAEEKLDEVLGKGEPAVAIDDESMPVRPPAAKTPAKKPQGGQGRQGDEGSGREGGQEGAGQGGESHESGQDSQAQGQVAPVQAGASSRRSLRGWEGGSVFVEVTRLFTVVLLTAAGFMIGKDLAPNSAELSGICGMLGCLVGYLTGGVLGPVPRARGRCRRASGRPGPTPAGARRNGRWRRRRRLRTDGRGSPRVDGASGRDLDRDRRAPRVVRDVHRLPPRGAQERRAVRDGGLSTRPLVRARPYDDADGFIVDSSAVMDGQLLPLSRSGLFRDDLFVPRFVLDELQGMADANDERSRRARRGLEILEVLRREAPSRVSSSTTRCPRSTRSMPSSSRSRAGSSSDC